MSIERTKNSTNEVEQQQLRNLLQLSNEQLEKVRSDLKQAILKNDEYAQTINELNSHNNLLETKLIEAMEFVDLRNKVLLDYEQQIDRIKNDLLQKNKEVLEKQSHTEQLEKQLIDKTAEVAQLTETLEADLVKNQHRERFAEDNATKAFSDIKVLQREVKQRSSFFLRKHKIF